MATELTTTTSELGDSRVRVEVEVAPEALEQELRSAAGELGRDLRVPGFRKGKVPAQVVIQQVGREAVLDEAVRRGLPGWYDQAIAAAGVAVVGDPKVDLADLPRKGSPLAFTIEVGVRPKAALGAYKGVEVGRREPQPDPDEVQAELERMRESLAALETVERPAADGDYVVIDFVGTVDGEPFEGGEARGYLLELGSGRLVEGFEEGLRGAAAGEERELAVRFPEEFGNEALAGRDAAFAVEVKEVKEKRLPELDDDFAVEAGGFDSLAELRAEVEARIARAEQERIAGEFREAAVDAVVDEATIELPPELVHAKAHEMWHLTARRLSGRGLDPERYLQLAGKTEEEVVTEAEPEARKAIERESVLAAIVAQEGIEVSDDELLDALREVARSGGGEPSDKALRRSLKKARSRGGDDALREDIAMHKAVDLVVGQAKPIPIERARAREELWTPDRERGREGAGQLWTPGS